jgi:hypothetical protein
MAWATPKQRLLRKQLRRRIRNARERDFMIDNAIASPFKNGLLITRRTLTLGNKVYPPGSSIPPTLAGRNLRILLNTGAVWWAPCGTNVTASKPATLPEPPKPQPKREIEFVEVFDDPEASYRKTLELETAKCGGSRTTASDRLMADPRGRALYLQATKIACAKESRRRGKVSISPSLIGL